MTDILQILLIGAVLGGVYALMASGLTLIFGVMKIINLAHPIFIIIGAYISYWLFRLVGLDPILSMPIAMIVLFCLGIVVYKLIFECFSPSRWRCPSMVCSASCSAISSASPRHPMRWKPSCWATSSCRRASSTRG
jgi:branched-subunit amino acid ABC-type transport system permease component